MHLKYKSKIVYTSNITINALLWNDYAVWFISRFESSDKQINPMLWPWLLLFNSITWIGTRNYDVMGKILGVHCHSIMKMKSKIPCNETNKCFLGWLKIGYFAWNHTSYFGHFPKSQLIIETAHKHFPSYLGLSYHTFHHNNIFLVI